METTGKKYDWSEVSPDVKREYLFAVSSFLKDQGIISTEEYEAAVKTAEGMK